MNSKNRTDHLAALAELSHQYPNWRLGQLVANLADWADANVWDIEDDQMLEAVRLHLHTSAAPSSDVRA